MTLPEHDMTTREGAIVGLQQTRDALGRLVTQFKDVALQWGEESGAAERYAESYEAIEQAVREAFPLELEAKEQITDRSSEDETPDGAGDRTAGGDAERDILEAAL